LPQTRVIRFIGQEGERQLSLRPLRAQAQVDTKRLPLWPLAPNQGRETACQGDKIFMIRDLVLDLTVVPTTAGAALVRGVDIHEVHIGGKVQLVAAEFAHTNNAETTGMLYPISVAVHGHAIQRRQPAYARLESCLYDTVRQRRQVCSRVLH